MRSLVAMSLLAVATVVLAAEEAKEFTPKNQMYTAMMPGSDRSRSATEIVTIGKTRIPIESANSEIKNGATFTAASLGIPAVVIRDIPEAKRYETIRDAIVKQIKGKVVEEKEIKQAHVPGKEYLIEGEKSVARMQLFIIRGWVMYAIVEDSSKDKVNSKEADAFYAGFKLTDKAKNLVPK